MTDLRLDHIEHADAIGYLRTLPDESVNLCVTSPPYFGLRAYLPAGHENKAAEIGTEDTPSAYIARLVAVFTEVKRVLRADANLYVNLGDSYASAWSVGRRSEVGAGSMENGKRENRQNRLTDGLREKELMGIPWRFAFAMQDAGWLLREDIIWQKPAPMPESVRDRCTRAHEYIFHFVKQPRYWYDQQAVMEPAVNAGEIVKLGEKSFSHGQAIAAGIKPSGNGAKDEYLVTETRNRRSVWTVNTASYSGAHFATFPPALIEPIVLAGCPEWCCEQCGAPHEATFSTETALNMDRPQARRAAQLFTEKGLTDAHAAAIRAVGFADTGKALVTMSGAGHNTDETQRLADEAKAALGGYFREFAFGSKTPTGYAPSCTCNAGKRAGVVLDPFTGSGTVALVAKRLNRRYLGCDLNAEYVEMARARVESIPYTLFSLMEAQS